MCQGPGRAWGSERLLECEASHQIIHWSKYSSEKYCTVQFTVLYSLLYCTVYCTVLRPYLFTVNSNIQTSLLTLSLSDNNGECPLTIAVEHGLADSLQTILSLPEPHLDLTVTDGQGDNLAQLAVESEAGERERCVEMLCGDCRSVYILYILYCNTVRTVL